MSFAIITVMQCKMLYLSRVVYILVFIFVIMK